MRYEILSYLNDEKRRIGRLPTVALIGFGKTNRAVFDIIKGKYPIVIRNENVIPSFDEDLYSQARLIIGKDAFQSIGEDIAFVSPSVRRSRLSFCTDAGTSLLSDTDIFFKKQRRQVLAVTGSDGKSTVTAIAGELLRKAYTECSRDALPHRNASDIFRQGESVKNIFVGGNIGTPLATADISSASAYVIELSSFNLMYTEPTTERAVITNISENHLDWHADMEEYIAAKMNIARHTGGLVTDIDSPIMADMARKLCLFCAVSDRLTNEELRKVYRTKHTLTSDGKRIYINGAELLSVSDITVKERHNIKNFMLAIGLTLDYVSHSSILSCAKGFRGLPHRCEHFLTVNGTDFIDSSIDTTPIRTASTLESLGKSVKILMGGRGKDLSLAPLIEPLGKYAERIALYADEGKRIAEMCDNDAILSRREHRCFSDFESAVLWLICGITQNDTVILSPAAASYGEFSSFEERGRTFKTIIKNRFKI